MAGLSEFIDDLHTVLSKHYGHDLNFVTGEHIGCEEEKDVDGFRNITITMTVGLNSDEEVAT